MSHFGAGVPGSSLLAFGMTPTEAKAALDDIAKESDPVAKHLKLASICSTLFAAHGIDLVVVGGSAIEFYTEGAYVSGDVDLCVMKSNRPLTVRLRQEIMGQLGARGGPRSWELGGAFVDVLGDFETAARTPARTLAAPYGKVQVAPPEDLLVEKVLVSKYPQDYPPALDCAKKLATAALQAEVEIDWRETKRIARTAAFANWPEVKKLIDEQAKALKIRSPYHSDQ